MALLGEMHEMQSLGSWYNLPRAQGVAYATQESWLMNDTIRNNILFNAPMDENRYNKGLTLSGSQKARVTLARAIYADAKIILLDNVLAALDVHTAKWIVDKCLCGDLVKDRTIIFVTHNVVMTSKIAEFVVSLGLDGRVWNQGSISDALAKDKVLAREVTKDQEIFELAEKEIDATSPADESKKDGKLIVVEEIDIGHRSSDYRTDVVPRILGQPIWAGNGGASIQRPFFSEDYSFYWIAFLWMILGTFRASRTIHRDLVHSFLGTTFRWLDVTPTSRILARCTVDIQAVDGPIAGALRALLEMTVDVLTKFFAIVLFTPIFFFAGALVGFIGAQIYLAAQLSVKRELSNAQAPVLAQASRTFQNVTRWVNVHVDVLGGLFAASLAFYVVYFQNYRPFNIGFSLTMGSPNAMGFIELLLYWVRVLNRFEVQANSLERIQRYTTIEQEPKPTPAGEPPAYWPASGALSVDCLSAWYSPEGPKVLHEVSFNIKSGERVGVGTVYYNGIPTSKLNLDALRSNITIIPQVPELLMGSLRSNLDMFDQFNDAALKNASLTAGLSSLQEEMDEGKLTLDSQISAGGGNLSIGQRQIIALETHGHAVQAMVQGSKLLILDEATSAIGASGWNILRSSPTARFIYYRTDAVIQSSLRTELSGDTTLLTVAHRLQTIMDADKIMVLDAGCIVEFDMPKALLQKKHGLLRVLVDGSGDKEALYKMAQA
ncbi:P-loop containing nucleoside triphosphate hydrolase protein [Mycena maculata]|uniref:P-loop containing nucleoside triphosphate hydrolase protein n=1 Tax=Mycena maculata TaxID=230809 RepID=A0AAD7N4Q0_9AGAR|nr:P-loop containing nucleoside triphosphate hydrolase protein [Mycena maculata]